MFSVITLQQTQCLYDIQKQAFISPSWVWVSCIRSLSLRICELWRGFTSAMGVPHMCYTGIRQKISGSLRFVPLITMAVTYWRKPYHNNPRQDSALIRCSHIPLAKAIPTIKSVVKRQESTFHSPWGQRKGAGLNTIKGQLRTETNNSACHKIQWSFKRYEVYLYMLQRKMSKVCKGKETGSEIMNNVILCKICIYSLSELYRNIYIHK